MAGVGQSRSPAAKSSRSSTRYSPYENVEAKAYPHIFAYGGLTDPRVTYWEPAKWVARLRERNTSDNLSCSRSTWRRGTAAPRGAIEQLREMAADYAFALKIAGLRRHRPGKKKGRPEAALVRSSDAEKEKGRLRGLSY